MTSYAAMKGRAAPAAKAEAPAPAAPLTEAEEARIEANKSMVQAHMPDALPLIRALLADGLIDGWRNVLRCSLLDGAGHE